MVELILFIGLFYPKVALLVGYLTSSILPNPIPLWGDILMAILIPRFLFIIYIVINIETLPYAELWVVLHGVGLLCSAVEQRILNRLG